MKVRVLENMSSDAGHYSSFENIRYGEVVEARFATSKEDAVYIFGHELNRIGATVDRPELEHLYGDFVIVEE